MARGFAELPSQNQSPNELVLQALRDFMFERHGVLEEGWQVELRPSMISSDITFSQSSIKPNNKPKPPFIPAKDDTKPVLQDPILRSDPIETEEATIGFSFLGVLAHWFLLLVNIVGLGLILEEIEG
ncbi:hypothetical protein P8452_59787 [Trifolium repens]|nr:hypothetical protein P8452_59787 [Trifolium repens]